MTQHWKVGELAARTGLTVRTLHHYDAIGLLSPTGRTESMHGSGHRLYTAADVARLQQILSLKMLGFSLEQIGEYILRSDYNPQQVVRLHLERIREQAAEMARLADKLNTISIALNRAEVVSSDEFLTTIQEMTMIEKYYTPEQLEQLQKRREEAGPETAKLIADGPQMWTDLMAAVQAEMDAGTDPADPRAQALAHRWFGLVNAFTGGDPGIFKSLKRMYQNEEKVNGMDVKSKQPMFEYVEKARLAAGIQIPQ